MASLDDLRRLLAEEAEGGPSLRYEDRRLWMDLYGEPAFAALPLLLDVAEAVRRVLVDGEGVEVGVEVLSEALARLEGGV